MENNTNETVIDSNKEVLTSPAVELSQVVYKIPGNVLQLIVDQLAKLPMQDVVGLVNYIIALKAEKVENEVKEESEEKTPKKRSKV